MQGATVATYPFGYCVTTAEHQIVATEPKLPNRQGEERQHMSVMGGGQGQGLQPGGMDRHPLNRRGHGTLTMHEGVQISLREDLAEHLQTALPTAHARKPIVDQGNPHTSPLHPALRAL